MDDSDTRPQITESFFEHRQSFAVPWVERWMVLPNPFLSSLIPALRETGVGLADFSFSNNATNLGEIVLNIAIRKWNATVRIALDSVTFSAANPNWGEAPQLVSVFDQVATQIRDVAKASPVFQESTLLFHVTPGALDFGKTTASLVKKDAVGECLFCGLSLYKTDWVLTIDKSLRYEGAAFVRLQRKFGGDVLLTEVALRLYEDEVAALRLLGLNEVP